MNKMYHILVFITYQYLSQEEKHVTNINREIENLIQCRNTDWCLNLHEILIKKDCVIIVTDFIYGINLYDLRDRCRPYFTELEARNIIEKVIKAIAALR